MALLKPVDRPLVHRLFHRRYLQKAKAGGTNEIHSNHGADAQSRCRKRLRTTPSCKDGVFGNWRAQHGQSAQPNTTNNEENYAGFGTLGSFTFRDVRAIPNAPQPVSTCSGPTKIAFLGYVGGGVFRFQDGSLLQVSLTQSIDCIDFSALPATCVMNLKVTGGTGRFKNASGLLTLTETVVPLLFDTSGNPVFFAATGEITGTVSGVAKEADHQEDRQ